MAYFNHAFKKTFVMTDYIAPGAATTTSALDKGDLSLFNSKTWAPLDVATPECCQFVIASGAPYQNDKIGAHHGGYQETLKSKGINPKYVTKVWESVAQEAQQAVLNIGTTPSTVGDADCCPEFLCGENYHLRVDLKGSPVLWALNHNAYQEVTAYGGCCPTGAVTPTAVDPALIMIEWAKGISESPILSGGTSGGPFVIPVVSVASAADVAAGHITTLLYPEGFNIAAPGFVAAAQAAVQAVTGQGAGPAISTVDAYTSAFAAGDCAGLTLVGAYVSTKFGDCTFQPSSHYEIEPVKIYASEVDLNGDPCEFTGICISSECDGYQANGVGETAARDFIMSESYRQDFLATDLRIREITQGDDMLGTGPGQVDRTALYDRTMILHNVPRFNNPSGTFDNDQYLVEVLTLATVAGRLERDALRADLETVLNNCGNPCYDFDPSSGAGRCADASVIVAV